MADTKISDLNAAGALAGTEPLAIVQSAATVKTTVQDIADLVFAGSVTLSDLVAADGVLPEVCGGTGGQGGQTVTTSQPVINLTQTLNDAAVAFTVWKLNVIKTAADAASLFVDLQQGGVSQFKVFTGTGATLARPAIQVGSGSTNPGWILGTQGGGVGYCHVWPTGVTPTANNYVFGSDAVGNDVVVKSGSTITLNAPDFTLIYGPVWHANSYTQMPEMTAPAAGGANTVRLYAQDNGSGKTQLMALFSSGAAQQVAIEP